MTPSSASGPAAATPAQRSGLAVGVCTYRRLPSLLRTLEHVALALREARALARVIVVDNDGQDPAVETQVRALAARCDLDLTYRIEATPGISAARNAVFDEVDRQHLRFVAMLDDDEWPGPGWIRELMAEQQRADAVVVGGPVRPVFPPNRGDLERYARFWSVQHQLLDGKPFVFCTCNFLIDMVALERTPRPLFDEEFGLSGGGDTVFFRGLFYAGHAMAWAEAAYVHEEVPVSRASFGWMRQRRYRVGNHAVRWESVGGKGLRSVVKTLGLTARLAIYPLLGREPEARWVGWLLEFDKLRGRYKAHLGGVFVEYARPQAPGEKACR